MNFSYDPQNSNEYFEKTYFQVQNMKCSMLKSLAEANASQNAADFFEYCVDLHQTKLCVKSVDYPCAFTFTEMDNYANRVARWTRSLDLESGQVVALMMENRPEFLALTMGFAKAGLTVALINTNLNQDLLHHSLQTSDAKLVVCSRKTLINIQSMSTANKDSNLMKNLWLFCGENENSSHANILDANLLSSFASERLDRSVRNTLDPRSPLFYIFTSGTTGPSKAAKFSHKRFIGAAVTWAGPSGLKSEDSYYITLPLYHGNAGVVAVAPCYLLGNTIVLREKFSASNFWKDIRIHACVATIYIGELWRYLHNQPTQPNEGTESFSPLRVAIGNGLRPEIWSSICSRFHLTHIVEHYGSTEMPGDAVLNYFNKPGACGYLPPSEALRKSMNGEGGILVRYNIDDDCVDRNLHSGFCTVVNTGEVGEMIMRLPEGKYDGYVGQNATIRKLYSNVFESGDCWWSSGDLLKMDGSGFFYFVDRAGDSFRWKGENVSTNGKFSSFKELNSRVYGIKVPNTDGRAGMASILSDCPLNLVELTNFMQELLPAYARPIFITFTNKEHDKTSTLKFQKVKYANLGFNVPVDSVWMWESMSKQWIQLDESVKDSINNGKYRF